MQIIAANQSGSVILLPFLQTKPDVFEATDEVVTNVMDYINWVREHLGGERNGTNIR